MKPSDIYNRPVKSASKDIYHLLSKHLQEVSWDVDDEKNTEIEIRNHIYVCIDYRRFVSINSVWFQGKPVMIYRDAGREGEDKTDRFITDKNLFLEMIKYLISLRKEEFFDEHIAVIDPEKDCSELDKFYNYSFDISDF